jgi:hypothetical protein
MKETDVQKIKRLLEENLKARDGVDKAVDSWLFRLSHPLLRRKIKEAQKQGVNLTTHILSNKD